MTRFFVCLSVMVLSVQIHGTGQSGTAVTAGGTSTTNLERLHIEQYGVYKAVREISRKAHMPIGVDAILPIKEPTIVFDFPGGTVADLLNMLVSQAPDYGWEEGADGVIHVFRKNAQVSLLDVAVDYPGADKMTRQEIWQDLANRPEISDWLRANNCSRQEFFMGNEFRWNNDPISIAPGDRKLRQLFDEITVKSRSDGWFVLQSSSSSQPCRISLMLW